MVNVFVIKVKYDLYKVRGVLGNTFHDKVKQWHMEGHGCALVHVFVVNVRCDVMKIQGAICTCFRDKG